MLCVLWTLMLDSFMLPLTSPLVLLGRCWVEGGISSCHQVTELAARTHSTAVTFLDPAKVEFPIRLVILAFWAVWGTGMAFRPSLVVGYPT